MNTHAEILNTAMQNGWGTYIDDLGYTITRDDVILQLDFSDTTRIMVTTLDTRELYSMDTKNLAEFLTEEPSHA